MERLFVALRWYFLPGVEMAHEAIKSGRPVPRRSLVFRLAIIRVVPRLLVFALLVWSVVTSHWFIAAIVAAVAIGLGLQAWLITRFMLKRLGGTHARPDV